MASGLCACDWVCGNLAWDLDSVLQLMITVWTLTLNDIINPCFPHCRIHLQVRFQSCASKLIGGFSGKKITIKLKHFILLFSFSLFWIFNLFILIFWSLSGPGHYAFVVWKMSPFVFYRLKKVVQVWKNMRVNQLFSFWLHWLIWLY